MRIYELETRPEPLLGRLVAVWERSVRATHNFLPDAERERIKAYVPQALRAVEHLLITENAAGIPIAFMGIENSRLEMLFLAPEERGRGLGRRLMTLAAERYGVRELTVNEQNPQAVGFYEHLGFSVWKRTERDEEGGEYPLLYMRK